MTLFLASFPRSGNTLLRQILHSGWGIASGSIYPKDVGDNPALIRACGHVEFKRIRRNTDTLLLNPHDLPVKTHELPPDETGNAIYVLRDGRAACVSLWHFYDKQLSLEDIVCGRSRFGTWGRHVSSWLNSGRVSALIRYEDMVSKPDEVTRVLTGLFGSPAGDPMQPLQRRDDLAAADGKWVRSLNNWQAHWSDRLEDLFMQHNRSAYGQI